MKVLVTGGAGYIGSHTCVELLDAGHTVVVFDNFSNSSPLALHRIEQITGKKLHGDHFQWIRGDVRDNFQVRSALRQHDFDAVIHFAGVKSVGESVQDPIKYYDNNVVGLVNILEVMKHVKVKNLIFSSSATVYGEPEYVPLDERAALRVTNAYGRTKLMCEQIIYDLLVSDPTFKAATLRYFNPVGAHPSGLIGEDPSDIPNNLVPYITQVMIGKRPYVSIYGDDYDTPDGTGVRDYIHVVDLAKGHVAALNYLVNENKSCTVNLGTGKGYSVIEMIRAFSQVSGKNIPMKIVDRRPGDVGTCYSDPSKAEAMLGWKSQKTLEDMARDQWNWQSKNPEGYNDVHRSYLPKV